VYFVESGDTKLHTEVVGLTLLGFLVIKKSFAFDKFNLGVLHLCEIDVAHHFTTVLAIAGTNQVEWVVDGTDSHGE
jgi:hypothetical protein